LQERSVRDEDVPGRDLVPGVCPGFLRRNC
jgi:hypothetical protein